MSRFSPLFVVIALSFPLSACNTTNVLDLESSQGGTQSRSEIIEFVTVGRTTADQVAGKFGEPSTRFEIEGGGFSYDYSRFGDEGFVIITFDTAGVATEVRSSDDL